MARRWAGPGGLEIGAGGESRLRAFEGVLSIVGALETDAGNYTCVVENTAGVRRRPVSIVVSGQFSSGSLPPSVSSSSSSSSLICRSLANFASFFVSVWRIQYHSVVVGAAAAAAAGASSTWRLHQIISSTCPSLTSSAQHTCWQRRMSHLFPRKRSLPLVKVFSSDPWNVNDSSVSNKKVC